MSHYSINRRQFLQIAGMTVGAGVLAACAPAAAPTAGTAAGDAAPAAAATEMTLWCFASNRAQWYSSLIPAFQESYGSNVTIKVEELPNEEMHNKIQTALVAGTGAPDLGDINIDLFGRFVKGDKVGFIPVNDLLGDDIQNLYERSALLPWSWQGQYYGIGNELNACLMYYRWDELEAAGITAPIDTWEDYVAVGKQYVEATGKKWAAVPDMWWNYWYMFAAYDGGVFDAEGNVIFDNEAGKTVMQMLRDWVYTDEIAMLAPGGMIWAQPYYGAMAAGDFVTCFGAPWYQGFMKQNAPDLEGKWRMQPFPLWSSGAGAQTATHGGTGTCITEQTKDADAAWAFIKFCNLTNESVLQGFGMMNLFPTWKPAWEDERMQFADPYFDNQKPAEFITAVAPEMPPLNNSPYWPEVTDAFNRLVVTPVMQDKQSVDDAMAAARAEADRIMQG